jgi:sulfoxide reductase heme-binding subunit YedZ
VHFWWQVKADWREPLIYATALTLLLGWRAWRAGMRRLPRVTTAPSEA